MTYVLWFLLWCLDASKRLGQALARWWKRLLIGAVSAWFFINIFLILLFIFLEYNHYRYDDYAMAYFAYFLLLVSFPAGALIAYAMRPKELQATDR